MYAIHCTYLHMYKVGTKGWRQIVRKKNVRKRKEEEEGRGTWEEGRDKLQAVYCVLALTFLIRYTTC